MTASTNSSGMMRDGVLNHPPFGKTDETLFSGDSDDANSETDSDDTEHIDEDIDDSTVVLLEPSPENSNFENNRSFCATKWSQKLKIF